MIRDLVLLYNSKYKNDNTAEWKLKFWWLDSYKIVKTNLKESNYNIVKLNNTEKSETVSESRLKLYFLKCNTMLHNYQQKIDTQLDADSNFNIDSENDYVQHDSFTSLMNHQIHVTEDNTEYTDFNNSWHFSCRLLFTETQFFERKNETCCHYFIKSLNSEFIVIFLLLFMNHIIIASQATSFHMLNHFSAFTFFRSTTQTSVCFIIFFIFYCDQKSSSYFYTHTYNHHHHVWAIQSCY